MVEEKCYGRLVLTFSKEHIFILMWDYVAQNPSLKNFQTLYQECSDSSVLLKSFCSIRIPRPLFQKFLITSDSIGPNVEGIQ